MNGTCKSYNYPHCSQAVTDRQLVYYLTCVCIRVYSNAYSNACIRVYSNNACMLPVVYIIVNVYVPRLLDAHV